MTDASASDPAPLAAGEFGSWLTGIEGAIRGEHGSDVPCDGCTACCTSSQFVHIAPDEVETLTRIPRALLFPAPRMPTGHVLLGYDERGHCPMLIDGQCSIYEHRPRTCRTYDCRVFPAAAIDADDDKPSIVERARRWQFSFASDADRIRHDAVRAAASYLTTYRSELDDGLVPTNATQRAVLAVEIHGLFLAGDETATPTLVAPDPATVRAELTRRSGTGG